VSYCSCFGAFCRWHLAAWFGQTQLQPATKRGQQEPRYRALSTADEGLLLHVAFTLRADVIGTVAPSSFGTNGGSKLRRHPRYREAPPRFPPSAWRGNSPRSTDGRTPVERLKDPLTVHCVAQILTK